MQRLLQPKILIPMVLSVALLGVLLGVSDLKKLVGLVAHFPLSYLLFFLVLQLLYEAVRGIQWHFLLRALGVRVPVKAVAFSFLVGELARSVPIGNYFQNYLLNRTEGEDVGKTSAASTLIIVIEIIVSSVGVAILGIATWPWLRVVIVVGLALFLLVAWAFSRLHPDAALNRWMRGNKHLSRAADEVKQFREGVACLVRPRVLAVAVALAALYLVLAGGALFLVMHGIQVTNVSVTGALSVYFFSLAAELIIPMPTDIGVTEVSGVGALSGFGVARTSAVLIMLLLRVLTVLSSIAIAALALPFMWDEVRVAMQNRPKGSRERGGEGQAEGEEHAAPGPDEGDEAEAERERKARPSPVQS